MNELIKSLGQVTAVIGAQWGDEGKGKTVDMLAEQYDIIVRSCGGANAGHTIYVDGNKHIFHLLPSGCMHNGKQVVLGAGMVIHLPTLLEEIETLKEANINIIPNLLISSSAHILLDFHKEIDGALEMERNKEKTGKIGTTKRGIGPAYMDKAERVGLRIEELLKNDEEIKVAIEKRVASAKKRYGINVDLDAEIKNTVEAKNLLSSCIHNEIPLYLKNSLDDGKTILIEGAQATLLDIDHGTYPFVTSSSTSLAGALQGAGIAPKSLSSSIGVAKAYCTRVGAGTFITEITDETGDRLREKGGEYGATTGRPRRCGWLDISDLKYSAVINGFTGWNITKLDVLDDEEEIYVGIGMNLDGSVKYKKLPGWQASTEHLTSFDELPENAKSYIKFIEKQSGVPVLLVGTGQGREDMIIRTES